MCGYDEILTPRLARIFVGMSLKNALNCFSIYVRSPKPHISEIYEKVNVEKVHSIMACRTLSI